MPNEPYNLEQIREFWTAQALEHGEHPAASWSDVPVIEMEIREILSHLADGDRVLDIGCANGYSTMQFARAKRITIRGLDYIPEMIASARERLKKIASTLRGQASFDVGDMRRLDLADASFDKVVVIRVIINLADWEHQLQGLREAARMVKPGGRLLLSEATLQGWSQLNRFRSEWKLPEIPMPPFNRYLDEDQVREALADRLKLVDVVNFASSYYVGSRVLKPLLAQALGLDINVSDPGMNWNRWFSQLPACGDYGTQKLFIFEKPA